MAFVYHNKTHLQNFDLVSIVCSCLPMQLLVLLVYSK